MLVGGCKEKETSKVAVRLPSFPAIKSSIQKIACVGDSITYGSTLQDRKSESYPSQLSKRFGNTIQVKNFGVDGAAVQKTAILSYWNNLRRKSHNRIKCLEILKSSLKIKVCRHFSSKKRYRRIPQNIVTDF